MLHALIFHEKWHISVLIGELTFNNDQLNCYGVRNAFEVLISIFPVESFDTVALGKLYSIHKQTSVHYVKNEIQKPQTNKRIT